MRHISCTCAALAPVITANSEHMRNKSVEPLVFKREIDLPLAIVPLTHQSSILPRQTRQALVQRVRGVRVLGRRERLGGVTLVDGAVLRRVVDRSLPAQLVVLVNDWFTSCHVVAARERLCTEE